MTKLYVIIEAQLSYPYDDSLNRLESSCRLWNGHVTLGGTLTEFAEFRLNMSTFKRMFGVAPLSQVLSVPPAMNKFIKTLKVKGTRIIEVKK